MPSAGTFSMNGQAADARVTVHVPQLLSLTTRKLMSPHIFRRATPMARQMGYLPTTSKTEAGEQYSKGELTPPTDVRNRQASIASRDSSARTQQLSDVLIVGISCVISGVSCGQPHPRDWDSRLVPEEFFTVE